MRKREYQPGELVPCARCGEDKDQDDFHRGDSYCKDCRRAYAREYHARRKLEDPRYLSTKARRARDKYAKDATARVKRLESARAYRTRQRAQQRKTKQDIKAKWEDLQ